MKRCPQCEFIYEDDQSLCDMDGALLVFDTRTLPSLHALATVDGPVAPKAHWRHRTFPALAALILATVLSLVYFVSTQRTMPASAPMPPIPATPLSSGASTTTAPAVNDAAVTTKDETTPAKDESNPEPAKTDSTAVATNTATTKSPSPAAAKKANARTPTTQPKPE